MINVMKLNEFIDFMKQYTPPFTVLKTGTNKSDIQYEWSFTVDGVTTNYVLAPIGREPIKYVILSYSKGSDNFSNYHEEVVPVNDLETVLSEIIDVYKFVRSVDDTDVRTNDLNTVEAESKPNEFKEFLKELKVLVEKYM